MHCLRRSTAILDYFKEGSGNEKEKYGVTSSPDNLLFNRVLIDNIPVLAFGERFALNS